MTLQQHKELSIFICRSKLHTRVAFLDHRTFMYVDCHLWVEIVSVHQGASIAASVSPIDQFSCFTPGKHVTKTCLPEL